MRVVLAALAVLATLPYVGLKLLWLTGSTVGLNDPDAMSGGAMGAANAITLLMELTAAALAVALVLEVGRRIPGWLVQVPMFVGTGLLGGILVLLPIEGIRTVLTSPSTEQTTAAGDTAIQGWVFAMVYGGFAVLGVSLLAIFGLHSWDRWIRPGGWTTRLSTWAPVTPRQRGLTIAHALGMVAICLTELVVAARADLLGSHGIMAVLMAVVSSAGLIALALRTPGSLRGSTALVMAYVGAAAVAAWGLYFFVVMLIPSPLRTTDPMPTALITLEFLRGLSGVITVVVAARLRPASR
ncbi:hypothetical protein N802_12605 [Knoellia sinensis KCTC 19936]|uniref:Uncharacterized protein n=1 Tax=Knoellia sinensis KCTC 19936 TaxID=1385520 RepID=A0A0A0JFN1_9MICO|nr:hypothetical protein N802_12605 [Knoellia sinensis KCTC 19936]